MNLQVVLCTLAIAVRLLCRFVNRYRAVINAAINASGESTENKNKLKAVLSAVDGVCDVIGVFVYPPF